jgi:hypothetical protein
VSGDGTMSNAIAAEIEAGQRCPTCGSRGRPSSCAKPECVRAAAAYATAPRAIHVVETTAMFDGKPVPGFWEVVTMHMSREGAELMAAEMRKAYAGISLPKPVRTRALELKP